MLEEFRPTQSFRRCLVQQTLQEGFEFGTHILRELDWILHDEVNEGVDRISVEGWLTDEKFVDNDTQRP